MWARIVLLGLSLVVFKVSAAPEATRVLAAEPAEFTPNTVGGGGTVVTDSPHFRVFGGNATQRAACINMLEAAYTCFITDLGWRSTGLSRNTDSNDGPWYKTNIYARDKLNNAAGVQNADAKTGMAWFEVVNQYLATPGVTVHEYGHGLTYHERNWWEQTRTGAWWEAVANWVADTHLTSPSCARARALYNISEGDTTIDLPKNIGDSHQVIVDGTSGSGNYYQAWPLLSYLHNNPDNFAGLGNTTLRQLWRQYNLRSNETPLHTLARVSTNASVQQLVGRYWARMAFVDIGHTKARILFQSTRSRLNYANLDSLQGGNYRVKAARQPRYMGANIIPLKKTGDVVIAVRVTTAVANTSYTATLAVRNTASLAVRYLVLVDGSLSANVATGEEATLVVANTPATLLLFDPFNLSADASRGLDYQVSISGATV
jgi:hypothetical protein